jgi:hypothetical protein
MEVDGEFQIDYTGQLLHSKVLYNSEIVQVNEDATRLIRKQDYLANKVAIVVNNETKIVPLTSVSIPIHVRFV